MLLQAASPWLFLPPLVDSVTYLPPSVFSAGGVLQRHDTLLSLRHHLYQRWRLHWEHQASMVQLEDVRQQRQESCDSVKNTSAALSFVSCKQCTNGENVKGFVIVKCFLGTLWNWITLVGVLMVCDVWVEQLHATSLVLTCCYRNVDGSFKKVR